MKSVIFKKYARALAAAGTELKIFEKLLSELERAGAEIALNPAVKIYLHDSRVGSADQRTLLEKAFSPALSASAVNFLLILIKDKNIDFLESVLDEARRLKREQENAIQAEIITAEPLSAKLKQRTVKVLSQKTGKDVIIENSTDKNIIGGMIVRMGDLLIDASLRGKIKRLRNKITQLT